MAAALMLLVSLPAVTVSSLAASDKEAASASPVGGVEAIYRYRNYTEIKNILLEIESQHSDIAKVYDIGNSWEKNHMLGDRDILAIKISDNVLDDEEEPEVLVVGLHHAREWTTSELVTEMVRNLTAGYGNDSRISWLVDNREIWLVPIVNPDGLDYALSTDEWWRKNRRLNYDGSYGVDLNRNYDGSMNGDPAGEWGGVGSSHTPSDETYCGEAPFSEPETQAIRDLVLWHDFQIALDFHSYSELVLWPWGYTMNPTPDDDDLVRIGTEMAALNHYTPMQSVELYPTTGDSLDWLYGGFNIFAFCFEIGAEFHPSDEDTVRSIMSDNLLAALLGIEIAGDKHEKAFEIVHSAAASRNYSASGFGISADITADRGVNTSSLRVLYRVNGEAWMEVPMAEIAANDTYEGVIPPLSVGSTVEYYIVARDSSGIELLSPKYAPYDLHAFVVTPAIRDDPPVVSHTPRGETASIDTIFVPEGIEIRASAIDDHGLRGVSLSYRETNAVEPFVAIDMAHVSGDVYAAVIPSTHDAGAEYYIEATDDKNQISRSPADAPDVLYLSYNTPPVLGPVTMPGSPPGNVSYGQEVEVSIEVSDDFGVSDVAMIILDQYMAEYDRKSMSLKSGTAQAGVWCAMFNTGPAPGVIFLDFVGSDGRASAELASPAIHVRDTTAPRLEHEYRSLLPEDDPGLSVKASDDIGIVQVRSFFALGNSQSFQALAMARVSGTETNGLYECVLPLGDFEGEVRYYFEAYDGTLASTLPADAPASFFVSTVTDPTPLEVLFDPPSSVEGSLGFTLGAEARNVSVDTTLVLHIRDVDTGASQDFTMTLVGPCSFLQVIQAGQMFGEYAVWLTALAGGEEIWSSSEADLTVTDQTAPEVELQCAQQLDKDRLVVSITCSDAYGVQSVIVHYKFHSEDFVRTMEMSLVSGTEKCGAWSAVIPLGGANEVEYRFVASDGLQSTNLPEGWLLFSLGEDGGSRSVGTTIVIIAIVAFVAGALSYLAFNRARRF